MEDLVPSVIIPGACAILLAVLFTWVWTHDYEELSADLLAKLKIGKEDEGGILWQRTQNFLH